MKSVLLVSTRTAAGKTCVGLGLALNWKQRGKKVGYFKPWADRLKQGNDMVYDRDAEVFSTCLDIRRSLKELSIAHDYEMLLEDSRRQKTDYQALLTKSFDKISSGRDFLVIEGPRNYSYGSFIQLSAGKIAKTLDCKVVMVANGDMGVVMDKALACNYIMESTGVSTLGVIINEVRKDAWEDMEKIARPALEEKGIEVLGIVPWKPEVSRLTPRLIAEELGAEVIAGNKGLDGEVKHTLVGAMTVEHALKGMRKYRNIALITGGDRTDMQLASFEASLSCLILSGGIYPDTIVLSKAEESGIPILTVKEYTYETARYLEHIEPWIKAEDEKKITYLKKLMDESLEVKRIADLL